MEREVCEQSGPVDEWTLSHGVVDEVDEYSKSVAGVDIEAVRAGLGSGPNDVRTAQGGRFTFTSCSVGFPMTSRTTIPDDRVICAVITAAPPGSCWCGIDLRRGSILAYGPGTEHTAINLPGLQFSFAIASVEQLAESADALELHLMVPPRGEVHELSLTDRTRPLGSSLSSFAEVLDSNYRLRKPAADDVLRTMCTAFSEDRRVRRVGAGAHLDSRHVVHVCIDYAHAIQRIPSISELCAAADVSERRLRQAFVEQFRLPPTRYFRYWALELTHRRLRESSPLDHSVTRIASDVGFNHLGRFAGFYRALYDESPSTTLQSLAAGVH